MYSQGTESKKSATDSGPRPLDGLRVLDFTIVLSGPLCTRMLADAGAEVTKIESAEADIVRQRPPFRAGESTFYASLNCGKRSMKLDLKDAANAEIVRRLVRQADVLVENFRPGVMQRLGLGYRDLAEINPRLVYCSISGFGQTGPAARVPAYAPIIHATSGLELAHMEYQAGKIDRPANNGIFTADVLGGVHAFGAINLALLERTKSGLGQHIDLSLFESVLGMLVYELQAAQFPDTRKRQVYEPVRAKDGYVMVAAVTPKNQNALFDVIGFPEGRTDPRFSTLQRKEENWFALLGIVERWTSQLTARECEERLVAAGIPCARYRTVAEAMQDEQVAHRRFLSELGSPNEPFLVANVPYRFSRSVVRAKPIVGKLGEHNAEIVNELGRCEGAKRD